jgi:hypothetical protein
MRGPLPHQERQEARHQVRASNHPPPHQLVGWGAVVVPLPQRLARCLALREHVGGGFGYLQVLNPPSTCSLTTRLPPRVLLDVFSYHWSQNSRRVKSTLLPPAYHPTPGMPLTTKKNVLPQFASLITQRRQGRAKSRSKSSFAATSWTRSNLWVRAGALTKVGARLGTTSWARSKLWTIAGAWTRAGAKSGARYGFIARQRGRQ